MLQFFNHKHNLLKYSIFAVIGLAFVGGISGASIYSKGAPKQAITGWKRANPIWHHTNKPLKAHKLPVLHSVSQQNVSIRPKIEGRTKHAIRKYQTGYHGSRIDTKLTTIPENHRHITQHYKDDMYGYYGGNYHDGLGQGDDEGSPFHGNHIDIPNEGHYSTPLALDYYGTGRYHGYLSLELRHHPRYYTGNSHRGIFDLTSTTHDVGDEGRNYQANDMMKIWFQKKLDAAGKVIYVNYPHGARVAMTDKNGNTKLKYVDVRLRVSAIRVYTPWRGEYTFRANRENNKGPYSIIFSHNIADGLWMNGITHMHISYFFYKLGSHYNPKDQVSVPHSYMQLGTIFPLSKYGQKRKSGQDDAANNMGYTHYFDNHYGLYHDDHYRGAKKYDPTSESIAPGLGNKEWVPNKHSIIRAYKSTIIQPSKVEPYAIGGAYGTRSDGMDNDSIIIPSTMDTSGSKKYIFDIDVGSAAGYDSFKPNTKLKVKPKPKKCVRVHYVNAETWHRYNQAQHDGGWIGVKPGHDIRKPIKMSQKRLYPGKKNGKLTDWFYASLKRNYVNWKKYCAYGSQAGYRLASRTDGFNQRAKRDEQHAKESYDSRDKKGKYTFTFKYSNKYHCYNLYVFLEPPTPHPIQNNNKAGFVHKTLEEKSGNGYKIVPGYPTPYNNTASPSKIANTSYGSKKYAYLVWGRVPDRARSETIDTPQLKYSANINNTQPYVEYYLKTNIIPHPFKDAELHISDTLNYSNYDDGYHNYINTSRSNYPEDKLVRNKDSKGRPNNQPFARLLEVTPLSSIGNKPTTDPTNQGKGSLDIKLDANNFQDYAGKYFAYRMPIQVGKGANGQSLLPGISDSQSCNPWNKFTNSGSNFKFWNHAFMDYRLDDFKKSVNDIQKAFDKDAVDKKDTMTGIAARDISEVQHSAGFNKLSPSQKQQRIMSKIKSDVNEPLHTWSIGELSKAKNYPTKTRTISDDGNSPYSNYVPLQIPMIHYDIYHYNYGNGSQDIPPDIISSDGMNDSFHKHFRNRQLTPGKDKHGAAHGWFMKDWGYGYAGQPVNVPITPQVPKPNKFKTSSQTVDINNCGKLLKNGDLEPNSTYGNYRFAYRDSHYFKHHKPFERIYLGKNKYLNNDNHGKNSSWKSHKQGFYKPYVKPQMGMSFGRIIVDTGNMKAPFGSGSNTRNGLPFWMNFKPVPTRWSPSANGKVGNIKDDYGNTNIKVSIADPTDKEASSKVLFKDYYKASQLFTTNNKSQVIPKYVEVPHPDKSYGKSGNGVLSLRGNELTRYNKGDAIPLRIKIRAVPINKTKPFAEFLDATHYSEGYVATDDKIVHKDFKPKNAYSATTSGYFHNSDSRKISADNSGNPYHNDIDSTPGKTAPGNINRDSVSHTTSWVQIKQPERTIRYFAGDFPDYRLDSSVLDGDSNIDKALDKRDGNNAKQAERLPSNDPSIRVQREKLKVSQNNRRPYVVNLQTKATKPIHMENNGAVDKVTIGNTTYNLSTMSKAQAEAFNQKYAIVYPATFKTGYGIRPDITISYSGNIRVGQYANKGALASFAYPSEWGADDGTAQIDNHKDELDGTLDGKANIIHSHGKKDVPHTGHANGDSSTNHSIASSAYYSVPVRHKITTSHFYRTNPLVKNNIRTMTKEQTLSPMDNYNNDSASMAMNMDNVFDSNLYEWHNKPTYSYRKPYIPTTSGYGVIHYRFPPTALKNDTGMVQSNTNTSNSMNKINVSHTGVPRSIRRMFTPVWLPLGNYQTVFERDFSVTPQGKTRAQRLGGNWLDFEVGRPDTAVAHMLLTDKNPEDKYSKQFSMVNDKILKPGKHGTYSSADEQLRDELSLQPVITRQVTKFNRAADFPAMYGPMKQNSKWPWTSFNDNWFKSLHF